MICESDKDERDVDDGALLSASAARSVLLQQPKPCVGGVYVDCCSPSLSLPNSYHSSEVRVPVFFNILLVKSLS